MIQNMFIHGNIGLFSTVAFVYISYAGVTKIAAIAEEIKNPSRNIPLAIIISLVTITIVYVSVTYVLVGNLPVEDIKTDIKPIFTLVHFLGGEYFGYAAALLGVITLISMANSGVLASSRFPFAMARDKLMPEFMSRVHPNYLTPTATIILTCSIMALVILFLDVEKIAKLASAFTVMMFISANACVIILRETSVQWYTPTYRAPLYPFIQIFGILSGFALLVFLGLFPFIAILVITGIGIIIYSFYGIKTTRTGVLRRYGHRPALYLIYKQQKNYTRLKAAFERKNQASLETKLVSDAGVVIPLFGNEKSPDMLIEIGTAINEKAKIQAVNITEVPDQTYLDAVMEENPKITALKRK
ncbi:MAG TPA: amino acid permease, partial [Bacteroidetes bacterium]|nr:amino acid permease [Bacteroidota bacterium]